MTTTARYDVAPDVGWTHDGGGAAPLRVFVARLPHGPIHVLNGTAAVVWQEALRGGSIGLCERVAAASGVPVEAVREDVPDFIAQLRDRGLLVLA